MCVWAAGRSRILILLRFVWSINPHPSRHRRWEFRNEIFRGKIYLLALQTFHCKLLTDKVSASRRTIMRGCLLFILRACHSESAYSQVRMWCGVCGTEVVFLHLHINSKILRLIQDLAESFLCPLAAKSATLP